RVHDARPRAAAGGGAGGPRRVPPGAPRQRPDPPARGNAPRGALLPALRRVPQRVSRLPPDRRPRLRLHLSRAHRHPVDGDARRRLDADARPPRRRAAHVPGALEGSGAGGPVTSRVEFLSRIRGEMAKTRGLFPARTAPRPAEPRAVAETLRRELAERWPAA